MKKLLIIMLLLPVWAWGASETQSAGSYDQGTNWNSPGNITGDDDGSCTHYFTAGQDIITVYNFGFSSVTGTVDSINVRFHMYAAASSQADREIEAQLTKTGGTTNTGVGTLYEDIGPGSALSNCGDAADIDEEGNVLWGTTWTAAEITASGFGINIANDNSSDAFRGIDGVYITVYYTEGGEADKRWKILK